MRGFSGRRRATYDREARIEELRSQALKELRSTGSWTEGQKVGAAPTKRPIFDGGAADETPAGGGGPAKRRRLRSGSGSSSASGKVFCRCLKRNAKCTCSADRTWLQEKREALVPYVPPHIKARRESLEMRKQEIAEKFANEGNRDVLAVKREQKPPAGPNIRTLAREWEAELEHPGRCQLNPLQAGIKVSIDDRGLVAECEKVLPEEGLSGQGVKGLPLVWGGQYQFEVELLCDCKCTIGWSSSMSTPGFFDTQSYGYASDAKSVSGDEIRRFGRDFGRKGDIIGACIAWTEDDFEISFVLNGRHLGAAFFKSCTEEGSSPVPLQPHICQTSDGSPFRVRLRGASDLHPLTHPVEGFCPIANVAGDHFAPFSIATKLASEERACAFITPKRLLNFHVPDEHVVELVDVADGFSIDDVFEAIAEILVQEGVPSVTDDALYLRPTSTCTALVAFKRASHALTLVMACVHNEVDPELFTARSLEQATASSRQQLRQWRGGDYRPPTDVSAARRLIHGSLRTPIPLAHLKQERPVQYKHT